MGDECNLGLSVFVDSGAVIGNYVKLQNRVSVYRGVTLEDGVFVGPHTTFTNDKYPRAITPDGRPMSEEGWEKVATLVKRGASIGAGCVVLPGVTIGAWAMIGADSLVTADVPDQGLAVGSPARLVGYVCRCGRPLERAASWLCRRCNVSYDLPALEPPPAAAGRRSWRRD